MKLLRNPLLYRILHFVEILLQPIWKYIFQYTEKFKLISPSRLESGSVAIDVTYEFTSSKFRGIGNYSRWFLTVLQEKFPELIYIAHVGQEVVILKPTGHVNNESFEVVTKFSDIHAVAHLKKINLCIFLSPFEEEIKSLRIENLQSWIVLYDLIPLYRPWQFKSISKYARYIKKVFQIRSLRVLTISKKTQKDLLYLFPEHAFNLSIPIEYLPANRGSLNSSFVTKDSFLVFVSKDPRKNTLKVIQAWDSMKFSKPCKLYLVGEMQMLNSTWHKLLQKNTTMTYIPNPSSSELDEIFKQCEYIIAPSLDEGLGLPLIEGALLGKKMIYSSIPSHLELVEKGGIPFNPKSKRDLLAVFDIINNGFEIEPLILKDHSREMAEFLSAL